MKRTRWTINVDFDVWKAITMLRNSENHTPNDVLRELLDLPEKIEESYLEYEGGKDWSPKGVHFPHSTQFRGKYKGQYHYGKVEDGVLVVDDQKFTSPSSAAGYVTGNSVNGWQFWECKFPDEDEWRLINRVRR